MNTGGVVKVMKKLPSEYMIPKPRKFRVNEMWCKHFSDLLSSETLSVQETPQGCAVCSDSRSSVFTIIPIMVSVWG